MDDDERTGGEVLVFEDGQGRLLAIPIDDLEQYVVADDEAADVRVRALAADDRHPSADHEVTGFSLDDPMRLQCIGSFTVDLAPPPLPGEQRRWPAKWYKKLPPT